MRLSEISMSVNSNETLANMAAGKEPQCKKKKNKMNFGSTRPPRAPAKAPKDSMGQNKSRDN